MNIGKRKFDWHINVAFLLWISLTASHFYMFELFVCEMERFLMTLENENGVPLSIDTSF